MVRNIVQLTELTKDEKEFAAENHHIVENFLKYRHLNRDEYYEVVIFGYLRAVKKYFMRSELWLYNFSTIALYSMKSDLYNHYRKQRRKKRTADVVSLDSMAYEDGNLTVAEITAAPGSVTDVLEAKTLWNEITAKLSGDCVDILRMRVTGYTNREIAKNCGVKVKDVDGIMEQIRETVSSMRLV